MMYVTCPRCGRILFQVSVGKDVAQVKINCPKCGHKLTALIKDEELKIEQEK